MEGYILHELICTLSDDSRVIVQVCGKGGRLCDRILLLPEYLDWWTGIHLDVLQEDKSVQRISEELGERLDHQVNGWLNHICPSQLLCDASTHEHRPHPYLD